MKSHKKNLKGKNILITGITGFIGSHLSKELEKYDAHVYGISRHFESNNIAKVNILDYKKLEKIILDKKISMCINLAAESLVESGQGNPYDTLQVNILGTLNILELARKHELEKVIITSTSHVYGTNKLPFKESYTPKPTRPYETSKTCTDIIAQSYADSFQIPVLIPRFVNIYGPGDKNFNRLIPKTVKSIILNEAPTMWGGDIVRDYLYIDDVVEAYFALIFHSVSSSKSNRIFNFGGNTHISVEKLIRKIIRLSRKKIKINKIYEERQNEINKQYVSYIKAKNILNWEPKIRLQDGLLQTLQWYEDYFKKTKQI